MATSPKEGLKHNNTLRDFHGINTQSSRTTIGDDEFAWLENVIPIGFGNARAVPGPSVALATWAPDVCYFHQSENLNGIDYDYIFTQSGAAYQVNLDDYTVVQFAPARTFSSAGTTLAQWQNTQILIVDPMTGYFSWDGSTLTRWNGTVQSLTITSIGVHYNSAPILTFSPSPTGDTATATSDLQVGLATLTDGGTGYAVNDILTVLGGFFVVPAVLQVSAVDGSGVITGFNLTATGDYTVPPDNPVSVSGGYGDAATFTLNFGVGPVKIINPGSGYTSNPMVSITFGGGGVGAAITAQISVVPENGTAIAAYGGRVWVATGFGRTVAFSAPNSFNDFTSGNAGGSFIISDEALHSTISAMMSANNFLYIFGVSSVNVLSGVTVVNGETIFTNTNISADVGSADMQSLVAFNRSIWFWTPYGFQALYGSTTQKTSDKLDGIFPLFLNTEPVSSGVAVIFNVRTLCFLVQYNDPVAGPRALLANYLDKKWWFSSQGDDLKLITSAIINDVPTLYGTNGMSLFKLFSDPLYQVKQTIKTKLWDMGDPLRVKQSLKFGVEHIIPGSPATNDILVPVVWTNASKTIVIWTNALFQVCDWTYVSLQVDPITGTIDTEYSSKNWPFEFGNFSNTADWINASGIIVFWQNRSLETVLWLESGYIFDALDVQAYGFYLGATINGQSAGEVYQAFHMQYEFRASWP